MAYKDPRGITIEIDPFLTSSVYRFTKLHLYEVLGGEIASGTVDLENDGSEAALELVTTVYNFTIKIDIKEGFSYEIPCFITNKRYLKNYLSLDFVCLKDKKFITQPLSLDYPDITTALNSVYPGKIDLRCESDINNEVKIYQSGEISHSFCTRLAYSFKHKTIFSYGWEGFMIKEVPGIDSNGEQEPSMGLPVPGAAFQKDPYNLNYDRNIFYLPIDPWDTEDYSEVIKSTGINAMYDFNGYYLVAADHKQLLDNYLYNRRFMKSPLYTSFRIVCTEWPKYKIGDMLILHHLDEKTQPPFTKFIVSSNEMFLALDGSDIVDENGFTFSFTSMLRGVEVGEEILGDTDPTDEEGE